MIFRALAALLVIVALPLLVLGVQEPHPNWRFMIALSLVILLFAYAAVTGKAPFFFR
jgi:ABC-type antimicrobial peptide transport system permease subunit